MKLRRTGDFHTAVVPRPSPRATLPRASRHGQGGVGKDPSWETRSPSTAKPMFPKTPLGKGAGSLEPPASQRLPRAVRAREAAERRMRGRSRGSPRGSPAPPPRSPHLTRARNLPRHHGDTTRPISAHGTHRHGNAPPNPQRALPPGPAPYPLLRGAVPHLSKGWAWPTEGERPIAVRLLLWCPMGARRPRGS